MNTRDKRWEELATRLVDRGSWPSEVDGLRVSLLVSPAKLDSLPPYDAVLLAIKLHEALEYSASILSGSAPALLDRARAGPKMLTAYETAAATLSELQGQLSILQERHIQAARDLEEAGQLRAAIVELETDTRRLEVLAGGLDELRNQLHELENALSPAQVEAKEVERQLGEKARALVRLRDTQLQELRKPLNEILLEAGRREQEFRAVSAEAKQAQRKYEEFDQVYRREKKILELYLEADQRVAEALGGEADAIRLLDDCRNLLRHADAALGRALDARAARGFEDPIGFVAGA